MTRELRPRLRAAALGIWAAALAGGCATGGGADARPPLPNAVETFDAAWARVAETHFDTTYNGVDWDAVRDELRPRAARATTQAELRDVVQEMLSRLGQSHFALVPGGGLRTTSSVSAAAPPPATDASHAPGADPAPASPASAASSAAPASPSPVPSDGAPSFDFRPVGDEVLVTRVVPGGQAWGAGVRPGWRWVEVDGISLHPLDPARVLPPSALGRGESERRVLLWEALRERTVGPAGRTVRLAFEDGKDRRREIDVPRDPRPGVPFRFPGLAEYWVDVDWRRLPAAGDPDAVGLLRFNIWMLPVAPGVAAAMDSLRGARGMIVDLRGNVGGVGDLTRGVAGYFVDRPVSLGTMRRRGADVSFTVRPRVVSSAGERVEPFTGPLAILVDEMTGSASEIFAGGLQDVGRARVFGATTAGAVLPAAMFVLPNGDAMLHAMADFETPSGVRLEGRGVLPDVPVSWTREDLLAGKDPPLEAALGWIETSLNQGAALP